MMRAWVTIIALTLAWTAISRADDGATTPRVAKERIVFSTNHGDLVLALYPDVAPRHVEQIINLVRLGAYDTTRFFRIEPGFIIQLSHIQDRQLLLTREQAEAEKALPAEFSTTLRHQLGSLSMARWEDPNSARSSFSIMLGNAPHLDGQYTIFGHLESGGSVLQSMLDVPRRDTAPTKRITVHRARVEDNIDAYYALNPRDPVAPVTDHSTAIDTADSLDASTSRALNFILLAVLAISLTGYFLYPRLTNRHLLSLLMLITLVSGFGLIIVSLPLTQHYTWLSVAIFFGMFGLFKLMSRFENR